MTNRLTPARMSSALSRALRHGKVSDEDGAVVFYDLSFLERRLEKLKTAFPEGTLHAVAAKANPLVPILKLSRRLGAGLEAATLAEVRSAELCGYEPSQIVFDSPAKTRDELAHALRAGIHINADSFDELERIGVLRRQIPSTGNIGLRINPQIGSGSIVTTNVAEKYSKFGVPLGEREDRIVDCYRTHAWLNGIHMHVGSQGCSVDQLVEAARRLVSLARKVGDQIRWVDIGGGMPVEYRSDEPVASMEDYVAGLRAHCPALFDGRYSLITEFGRYVHANAGWTASRVEYVKRDAGVNTAVIHVGADLLLRRCYEPHYWHHDFSVADRHGRLKPTEDLRQYTIAGPLCFGSDIVARGLMLPAIEEGDFLLIHDTGAYTLSMWSRYTSRQVPTVLGYRDDGRHFETLKARESTDELFRFWQ